MANANIFAQYLQAPQSVTSKIAALDQADFQRAQMEGAVRQNRLQELAFQRGEEDRAAAMRRAGALQRLAMESGGDESKYAAGLRAAGEFDMAGKIEEGMLGRKKTGAEIGKAEAEAGAKSFEQRMKELDVAIRDITMFDSPEAAIADIRAKVQGQKLPADQAANMERLIQSDPMWQTKLLKGLVSAKDRLEAEARAGTEARQAANETLVFDPKTGQWVENRPLVAAKARIAQAGATVTMGSPIAAELPSGQQVFVQPANRPGAAPQVLRVPNTGETLAPPTKQTAASMSPTLQKELIETDDTVSASRNVQTALQQALKLNKTAYSGFGADVRAKIRSNLPGESEGANATVEMNNIILGQALESLKATFGGAPTEGERKILIDLQASADKTPAQREALLNRAIQAAQRRENSAKAKAEAIRSGRYLTEGVRQPAQPQDQPKAQGAPKAGDVMDGYRFKGGNPADKANWEKM